MNMPLSTEPENQDKALPRELTHNLSRNVCVCYDVSKQEIIDTIKQGAKTLEEVSQKTYACQGSGCCIRQV
ncbi:MAG: (2Fe-2S)-binding protein, partial [Thiomicrorhabdus sp.]|nr:(2Fe-2S)-binding protein [Thiomicrorhabdus sp.]